MSDDPSDGPLARLLRATGPGAEGQFALLDALPCALQVMDTSGRIVRANEAHARMHGYSVQELLGLSAWDLEASAEAQRSLEGYLAYLVAEQPTPTPYHSTDRRKDGSFFERRSDWSYLRDADGAVVGLLSMLVDISQEAAATRADRHLASAIDQGHDSIVVTDLAGRIQHVNRAFEFTTGYKSAEVVGKNPRFLKSGQQDQDFYQEFWQTIEAGNPWAGMFVNRSKDGTLLREHKVVTPFRNRKGKVVGYIAVNRDASRELALYKQLQLGRGMEVVGRLAGGIAHDFSNVLTAIMGHAFLAGRGGLRAEDLRSRLDGIRECAAKGGGMSRQLLALAQPASTEPDCIDLNELAEKATTFLRSFIGENIRVRTTVAPAPIRVTGLEHQLEQVLLTLALDARDAMPEGGDLHIKTERSSLEASRCAASGGHLEAGPYIRLTVEDTRRGEGPANSDLLFGPLEEKANLGQGPGRSAGTVHEIIAIAGGDINLFSAPGRGQRVEILLPEREKYSGKSEPVPLGPEQVLQTGNETILLLDDDRMIRSTTSETLQELGYELLVASDGDQAMAIAGARQQPVDLLITDVVLGGMNVREVAQRMRAMFGGLRILFISGYAMDVVGRHEILGPGVQLLEKPFNPTELATRVRQVLDAGK